MADNEKLITLIPGAVPVATPWTSREILVAGFDEINNSRVGKGYFSIDVTFTGAARTLACTIQYTNGSTYDATNALTAFTAMSAGRQHVSLAIPLCRSFKVVLTATTDTCTVTECIVAMA